MTEAAKPKKKRGFVRRWTKRLVILAVLAVPLYLVLGYYVVPRAIVWFTLPALSSFVDGRIELDDLDLDPIFFTATVKGLRVYDQDDLKVLGLKRARGGISRTSLWLDEALIVDVAEADGLYANLVLREDGTLNLSDVFVVSEDDQPPSEEPLDLSWLPRIRLGGATVIDAVVKFDDRLHEGAKPRRVKLSSLNVGPIDTGSTAATPFNAELSSDLGESATAEGSLTLNPMRTSGEAVAAGLRLDAYQPYFGRFVPLTLRSGEAGATIGWTLDLTRDARVATAEVKQLAVTDFRLEEGDGNQAGADDSLVGFERFGLESLTVDALAHRAELASLGLDAAELTVEREADGTLPLVKAVNEAMRRIEELTASGPEEEAAGETPSAPPILPPPFDAAYEGLTRLLADVADPEATWTARLGEARVSRARARWSDAVPEGGAVLGLFPVDATAGPVDTRQQVEVPFKATLRVDDASAATDAATPDRGAPRIRVAEKPEQSEAARAIREKIIEESLAPADADLGRGLITAEGTLHVDDPMAELALVVRGLDLTGVNPYLPDAVPGLKILSSSIDLRTSPRIRPNKGALPVAVEDALIRVGGSIATQYGPSGVAPLTIPVTGLAVEYGPLNTKKPVEGRLSVDAIVAGGEVGVVGSAVPRPTRPAESDVDVDLGVAGLELPPLSPLIAPFLGRAIQSGELSLAMPVALHEGRLRTTAPIAIEDFKLGGKVDATGAESGGGGTLGVPIDLVVAVLKGPDNNLVLPPISLDVDLLSGEVNLGKAISSAFVGVLGGVASQPLKMLGGVASGGGKAVGQAVGGIKDAAGSVTGAAGGIGRGAGNAAGAVGGVMSDAAGGLFRGVGGLMGMGGDGEEEEAEAASPQGAVAVAGGETGKEAADAGIVQAVRFQPGTAAFAPGAREALDELSATLNRRGLGLALTPVLSPAEDGSALMADRARRAEDGRSAPDPPGSVATPAMLRNLALRRARTVRTYLLHAAEEDLRFPENAILLRPEAAESAEDPSAAWVEGDPGVRFELISPG